MAGCTQGNTRATASRRHLTPKRRSPRTAKSEASKTKKSECYTVIYLHENEENWKQIPHLPTYEASNFGRIRNTKTGTIRKPLICRKYYQRLSICGKSHLVHRLVMAAFLCRELAITELVRHLNDDGLDNRLENLAVGTAYDNWHDRRMNDRAGWKLRQRDVQRIRSDLKRRHAKLIAMDYGISHSHVRNIASGHRYGWLH
jgi:hypothetical protein